MTDKLKITVFSFACCNPQQGVYDQQYIGRINEALDKISVEAQVGSIYATDTLYGPNNDYIDQLKPLFNKYGMAVAPALFINDNLVLYGTVPSIKRLVKVLKENAVKNG